MTEMYTTKAFEHHTHNVLAEHPISKSVCTNFAATTAFILHPFLPIVEWEGLACFQHSNVSQRFFFNGVVRSGICADPIGSFTCVLYKVDSFSSWHHSGAVVSRLTVLLPQSSSQKFASQPGACLCRVSMLPSWFPSVRSGFLPQSNNVCWANRLL